ncbi:MAG: HD domain-containing protein [bacterium]|nr:MAG: HD domain-containing protein [bacterium]
MNETALTNGCLKEMKAHFGADRKRIDHALKVLDYARAIQAVEGGDTRVVTAAAILHDVGIPASEAKYGSIDGPYQEEEGPPIAREILKRVGADDAVTDHVCDIIADHHSAKFMDTLEFRILWDADWLVNIPNWYRDADEGKIRAVVRKVFKTGRGRAMAREIFLGERG